MTPAKIIEISDKVIVEYMKKTRATKLGKFLNIDHYSKTIAEAENVEKESNHFFLKNNIQILELNQTVFIEPIIKGKVKIVKI